MASLTPFTGAGGVVFKNRLGLAPLTRGRADPVSKCTKDIHATYYSQRATGGFVLTEATGISQQGSGWWGAPGLWTQEQLEAWKPVVAAVHAKNAVFAAQLWHMGRAGHSDVFGTQPVSASALPLSGEVTAAAGEKKPYEVPHALTVEEIKQVVADYATAARNALSVGFDAVQIHAANGYLIDQFLQSVSNVRTDEYGGSIENRLRFLKDILDAFVAFIPRHKIWIRFAPNGAFQGMGGTDNLELFDAAIELCASYKIGVIEVLDGLTFGFHEKTAPYTLERAREIIRKANPENTTALMGNCGHTKESADRLVAAGTADLISFGRLYMSNPDLPERFRDNLPLADVAPYPDWWLKADGDGYITYPTAAAAAAPAAA